MKFGTQLKSKSVPEWKSYNIDYNDLKHRIRIATEVTHKNDAFLKDLRNAFIDQIDMVNLFLHSKMGEVKRRIVYVENTVEQLEAHQNSNDSHPDLRIYDGLENDLNKLSSDLQKLSRFIVLQKTGLRKLLKKYTKYSGDGGELNMEINKYMIKNTNSFIYIDLTGFYLELALIYDLIRAQQTAADSPSSSASHRRSVSGNASYLLSNNAGPLADLSIDERFDFDAVKNGTQKQTFLVHYDNLTELKLLLLSQFYFIDQSVTHERKNLQLQRQKSSYSFRQLIERRSSVEDLNQKKGDHKRKLDPEIHEGIDERAEDIYRSNSIYINNTDELAKNDMTIIYMDDPKNMHSIKTDADPGLLLTDTSSKKSLLISAIGGLRKASSAVLNDEAFINDLLNSCENSETYETFVERHADFLESLNSLERISIEWLFSSHIKPLVKSNCNRARFTSNSNHNEKSKIQSWITLTSNIKFSTTDLNTNSWTESNISDSKEFPYALLEVRYSAHSTSHKLPPELKSLLSSHLIYKIENTFSALTYNLLSSNTLSFQPSWAQYFGESPTDIRKNPPRPVRQKRPKTSARTDSSLSLSAVSESSGDKGQGSVSAESSQFRYWNEFDNGSEGEDGAAFFVEVDSGDDQLLSGATMEYLYKIANTVASFIHEKVPFMAQEDDVTVTASTDGIHDGLLSPRLGSYAAYGATNGANYPTSGSTRMENSDLESMYADENGIMRTKKAHDYVRSFMSISSASLAILLVALACGVTASLLSWGNVSINALVILFLVFTYFASMSLSIVSIGFIMAVDEESRKIWQITFVWFAFVVVTLLTVGGTVALFGL